MRVNGRMDSCQYPGRDSDKGSGMNVQFYAGSKRPERAVSFLPCNQPTIVRLLCRPTDWVRVWLHFFNGRSVPCLGRGCQNCHDEPRLYAYGACIKGGWTHGRFVNGSPGIVCVSAGAWSVTEEDYRSLAIEFRKIGATKTSELTYRIIGDCLEPIEPPFNVRDRLMAMWKVRIGQDDAQRMEVKALRDQLRRGLGGPGEGEFETEDFKEI